MNRTFKYVIIALLVVLVCWRFGGFRAVAHGPWFGWGSSWSGWSDGGGSADSGPIVTRDYPWDEDRLELDVPGHLIFHPAPTWHLSLRGREGTLNRLVVSDGRISEQHHGFFFVWHRSHPVEVDLAGPALREATLNGSGSIELQGINQDSLHVRIRGSGSAGGSGKVETLRLEIMGSGSARLAQLATSNADVTIDGSGNADISPTGATEVTIAGSGDVRLHARPAQLSTHVYGSGRISEVPGAPAAAASPAPASGA
ncbi:MAG: GIN domain-containing protein [Steroidobacteraceae bacterium]